jgi:hypothetical protein
MEQRALTAKDIADWLTPSQAVEILDAAFNVSSHLSKKTLLNRLAGGMVIAASAHTVIEDSHPARRILYDLIPSEDWNEIDTLDSFWITGDLAYHRRSYGISGEKLVRHYGVKFEPLGVRAIIPSGAEEPPAMEQQASAEPEPEPKGPRVSDAHLQAWFEFYKKVHSEAEDTEDRALESARKNFPGKSVSRDRVRSLRGTQRRGPKRKDERSAK